MQLFLDVVNSLGINWQQFLGQAVALFLWICLLAAVYSAIEKATERSAAKGP
jgi:hypothetical protein